jgi:serine/threonine protein kinase
MVAEAEVDAQWDIVELDELVGTVINERFHVMELVARGGMANVYFATQAPLSRPVAIKVLHGVRRVDAESEESFRSRFLQEASILSKLQHPNIVVLLDYGLIGGLPGEQYFMAMEYLRGETLAQRFRTKGRLGIPESLNIAHQIGRGLREAHRLGFIHRDLKPSNIILVPEDDQHDIVKLVDFGIGKVMPSHRVAEQRMYPGEPYLQDREDATLAGLLLGSPRYMSPEQIRGGQVELRTDLYALGVILFQALTGRLPFEETAEFDLLMAHCMTTPPTLEQACPQQVFPEALSRLVGRCLEKPAELRPSIEEFLQELSAIEDEVYGALGVPASARGLITHRHLRESRPTLPALSLTPGAASSLRGTDVPFIPAAPLSPHQRRRRLAIAGLSLLAILAFGFVVFGAVGKPEPVRSAAASAVATLTAKHANPVPRAQAPASVTPGPVPVPERTGAFVLTIESKPSRAAVSEGGVTLGVTPLKVSIERRSVADGPRRFQLRRDGYATYTLEQGDSEQAVRVLAALEFSKKSIEKARAERAAQRPARSAEAVPSAPPRRNDSVNLDIRMQR